VHRGSRAVAEPVTVRAASLAEHRRAVGGLDRPGPLSGDEGRRCLSVWAEWGSPNPDPRTVPCGWSSRLRVV
jgi:hypothetical protein